MEIVLLIAAVILVVVVVYLRGKSWNSFIEDITKDKNEDK